MDEAVARALWMRYAWVVQEPLVSEARMAWRDIMTRRDKHLENAAKEVRTDIMVRGPSDCLPMWSGIRL